MRGHVWVCRGEDSAVQCHSMGGVRGRAEGHIQEHTQERTRECCTYPLVKGRQTGGFQTGGFPDLDLSFLFCPFCPFLSFLGLSRFFRDFPDLLGDGPGTFPIRRPFSLSRPILRAPTRNSPERVRDTIWTFPEKVGNPPVWKPPGLASLNLWRPTP